MLGNALMSVRNCTENEALALAFYLYQLCEDIKELDSSEECQVLYNALVDRLKLGNHVDAILNALLYRLERTRQLTPISEKERYKHPFDANGKLKTNYREDKSIYSNCGDWESKSQRDINLIRVLFSSSKNDFSRIRTGNFMAEMDKLYQKGFYLLNGYLENESYIFLSFDCMKNSKTEKQVLGVYNKNLNKGNILEIPLSSIFMGNLKDNALYLMASDDFIETQFPDAKRTENTDIYILKIKL